MTRKARLHKPIILTIVLMVAGLFVSLVGKIYAASYTPAVSAVDDWSTGFTLLAGDDSTVNNSTATNEVGEPNTGSPNGTNVANSLWYKFIPATGGNYGGTTCAVGGPDTVMNLYAAGDPDSLVNLSFLVNNDDSATACDSDFGSRINYDLTGGTTYYYQVGTYSTADAGVISFNIYYTGPSATAALTINDDTIFATTSGNFSFTGNAQGIGGVTSVMWRSYLEGQLSGDNWSNCTADDGTFNSASENYTCTIPTTSTDGQYYFEIKAEDASSSVIDHIFPVGMLDTAVNIDAWLSMTNIVNLGLEPGDGRSFGIISPIGTSIASTGKYGDGAVYFDGTSYFDINDPSHYLDYSGTDRNFSFNARIMPTSNGNGTVRDIYSRDWPGTSVSSSWKIRVNANNSVSILTRLDGAELEISSTASAVTADAWNDIWISFDVGNNIACLRINSSTDSCTAWLNSAEKYNSDAHFKIGENFVGIIDDIYFSRTGDATPPVISVTPLENADRVSTNSPSINVAFADTNGGVASARYCLEWDADTGCTWTDISLPGDGAWGGTSETATISFSGLSDGVHTVTIQSTDTNRNSSVNSFFITSAFFQGSYTFTVEAVDSTAPRIYANSVSPNPGIETKPSIRGYVKDYLTLGEGDTISNISGISYSLDGGDYTQVDALDGTYDSSREDFYFRIPSDLSLGEHTIRIRAVDSAGNNTSSNTVNETSGDVTLTFTVTSVTTNQASQNITQNITFDNHDLHDTIFSDAVWGNGIVRLRQQIDFAAGIEYAPANSDAFGHPYGNSDLGVFPSTDGNMWIAGNDGSMIYYNITTQTATHYENSLLKGNGTGIKNILEYEDGGNRYLIIAYLYEGSTIIYDIKNTPENTADDTTPYVNLSAGVGFLAGYSRLDPLGIDTRAATKAIYGIIWGSTQSVMRLDLNGTPMNLADDSFTVWGHSQGLMDDELGVYQGSPTGFYFDQAENKFLAFHYTEGMYVCDDNATPTNTADDTCTLPSDAGAVAVTNQVFAVIKDPNGWYWVGGDHGLLSLDLNGTMDRTDDIVVWALTDSDIGGDDISALKWIAGEYPVGDEVWAMTRLGRVRAIEYNFTYDDDLDNTTYKYKIDNYDFRAGGSSTFYMEDSDTIWIPVPGQGLNKISLSRSFVASNVVEIYPSTPAELLEIDHFLLSSVTGSVSTGSSSSLDDLLTYEISTDAGVTWREAFIGETINFTTSDYRLKIRITLLRGSTPIVESLSLSYVFQKKGTIDGEDTGGGTGSGSGNGGGETISVSPGAPNIFEVQTTDTTATLFINPPPMPYSYFYVAYSEDPSAMEHGVQFSQGYSSGAIEYTINGLKPETVYYFKVRTGNGSSVGSWGNIFQAGTTSSPTETNIYYRDIPTAVIQPIKETLEDLFTSDVTEMFEEIKPEIILVGELADDVSSGKLSLNEILDRLREFLVINLRAEQVALLSSFGLFISYIIGALLSLIGVGTMLFKVILPIYKVTGKSLPKLFGDIAVGYWKWLMAILPGWIILRKKKYALAYESVTGAPISGAYIVYYSSSGNLVTDFTDKKGMYQVVLVPDIYQIRAAAIGYLYPARIGPNGIKRIGRSYIPGEKIVVREESETRPIITIPMTAIKKRWKLIWYVSMDALQKLLAILGLVTSVYALIIDPKNYIMIFSLMLMLGYLGTWLTVGARRRRKTIYRSN